MGSMVSDISEGMVHTVNSYGHGRVYGQTSASVSLDALKRTAAQALQNGFLATVDRKFTVVTYVIEAELIINGPSPYETFDGKLGVIKDEDVERLRATMSTHNNRQFTDSFFPPGKNTLYFSDRAPKSIDIAKVQWLRPKDLTPAPQLVVDNVNKRDVIQGYLGDCWFLSACAAVTQNPKLLDKVIPKGQVLYGPQYKGFLVFRFWRFGEWVNVCIDDQLPTVNKELVYARCSNAQEFWVPLLEKAYAKLHGSYAALEGGQSKDGLVDLTGGFAECYSLAGVDYEFYQQLHRAYNSGAFITCSRKGEWSNNNQADRKGLVSGHAYTVTAVNTVPTRNGKRSNLLRVRNPWGDSAEWNGMWSDSSLKWTEVDAAIRKELEVVEKPDGEFWINFKDFCREFVEVTVCTLNLKENTDTKSLFGVWEYGKTCGGSRNNISSFARNPQYKLTIYNNNGQGGKKESSDLWGRRNVVIALMQEHRTSTNRHGLKMAHISFCIYQVPYDLNSRLPPEHFVYNPELTNSGPHTNFRETTLRLSLPPGCYVVIPSTFELNMPKPFLLRVYCDTPFDIKELRGEILSNWHHHRRQRQPALISIQL